MKHLLVLVILFYCQCSFSQSTNRVVNVASADGLLKTTSIHSFSIGEPIIATILSKQNILTQGFLQPIGKYYLFANRDSIPCYTWKIWPNPANEVVNINIDFSKSCFAKTDLRVIAANGVVMLIKIGLEGTNAIDCSRWAAGTYFIELFNNNERSSVSKVIVIH
jgi:Secretion system C-terminal sorting domain